MATEIGATGLSLVALGVSIVTFVISHKHTKKSEQIHISRELWINIDANEEFLEKWTAENDPNKRDDLKMVYVLDSLKSELRYFVLLTKTEMKDDGIREYYGDKLLRICKTILHINKLYPDSKAYSGTEEILNLIEEYHEIIGKSENYKETCYPMKTARQCFELY
jgi:hypothetical protein